jgi:pilus assembly protein CpaE
MNAPASALVAAAALEASLVSVVLVANPGSEGADLFAPSLVSAGAGPTPYLAPLSAVQPSDPRLSGAEVLIVEIDPGDQQQINHLTRIVRDFGSRLAVVAAGRNLTTLGLRRLRNTGIVEAISLPIEHEELNEALAAAREAVRANVERQVKQGRLIAVAGSIGGAGTTMLATQLGCQFAATKSTCLIDLNIQAGAAACYLDMIPQLTLVDLVDAGSRMDGDLLRSVTAEHSSGLRIVSGPSDMVPLDLINVAFIQDLLRLATQEFEVVILDLPPAWTDWSLAALTLADVILLVSALSVPGIRQAKRQMAVLDANGLGQQTRVTLNRVPKKMFRTVDLAESEKLIGHEIAFTIANDFPTVSAAVDQGRTIESVRRGSKVDADVKAIAAQLAADFAGAAE